MTNFKQGKKYMDVSGKVFKVVSATNNFIKLVSVKPKENTAKQTKGNQNV